MVLGLTVDINTPKLSKYYKSRIETHLNEITEFGISAHSSHSKFHTINGMNDHVCGLINYANEIDTKVESNYKKSLDDLDHSSGIG
jgi:RNA-directed DNA polymerase